MIFFLNFLRVLCIFLLFTTNIHPVSQHSYIGHGFDALNSPGMMLSYFFLFLLSARSVHLAESSFEQTPKITHNLGGSTHVEIKVPPNSIVHDAIALHEGHGPDSNNRRRLLLRSLQVSFELHPNSGRHLSKKL